MADEANGGRPPRGAGRARAALARAGACALLVLAALPTPLVGMGVLAGLGDPDDLAGGAAVGAVVLAAMLAPTTLWLALPAPASSGVGRAGRALGPRRALPVALARMVAETAVVGVALASSGVGPSALPPVLGVLRAALAAGLGSPGLDAALSSALPALSWAALIAAWAVAMATLGSPRVPQGRRRGRPDLSRWLP